MDIETVFLALRVVVALGAVFGALLLAHRWITKGRPGAAPRNRQISVVARQGLGQKAGIAVVDAGGRRYLLGVTEHAVTVLDTLGPAEAPTGEPALVASQPIAVARFEQELRTVTIATADVPVLVQGEPDPLHPGGPITRTVSILPATGVRTAAPMTGVITLSSLVQDRPQPARPASSALADVVYPSRRAMRAAEEAAQQPAAPQRWEAEQPSAQQPWDEQPAAPQRPPQAGPLAGSVLSPGTWKQTFDALKKLR
ncbi:FliO/MopB family protein [uncultured Amnibacterium sp.]|uniref:FliO/MopB family protein n=1 Tax=uncultured Amnibacterium sp. TaxID=1631851 RepID=UPI0035C9E2B2